MQLGRREILVIYQVKLEIFSPAHKLSFVPVMETDSVLSG